VIDAGTRAPDGHFPVTLPRDLPRQTMAEAIFLRICRTAHAGAEPGFRAAGVYRFDAPDRSFGTCYFARDFQTCGGGIASTSCWHPLGIGARA
jgi:hypothetical protein